MKYMKQKPIELEKGKKKITIVAGDLNTFLPTTDRTSKKKINKDTEKLNTVN